MDEKAGRLGEIACGQQGAGPQSEQQFGPVPEWHHRRVTPYYHDQRCKHLYFLRNLSRVHPNSNQRIPSKGVHDYG
jgi:hypothetical protein